MGYRTYIGYISKREYNKIKSMTKDELFAFYKINADDECEDEYPFKQCYDYGDKLFEFGKWTEFNPPKKTSKSFFKKKDTQEMYSENDFEVVTPEFLAYIINHYSEKVKAYYNKMLLPFMGDGEDKSKVTSEFLNSIKSKYNYPNNKYTFDFSKITEDEQTALFHMFEHIRSFAPEWGVASWFDDTLPYNLKFGDSVTTSWKYEYEIFEMVRIYKTFDWKKNVMIYYGW